MSLGMAGLCEENARRKVEVIAQRYPDAVVIGADTLVFLGDRLFKKPKDFPEAMETLQALSGRCHQVCTGVCIAGPGGGFEVFHEITEVYFKELSEREISEYIEREKPYDKAGSYGIQDSGGAVVDRIEGAYDNVMGLPVGGVLERLERRVSGDFL